MADIAIEVQNYDKEIPPLEGVPSGRGRKESGIIHGYFNREGPIAIGRKGRRRVQSIVIDLFLYQFPCKFVSIRRINS